MKIYTKTGDKGQTSLFDGQRVEKSHWRLHAYGTLDELNACLGVAAAFTEDEEVKLDIQRVQTYLFTLGSHLATEKTERHSQLPPLSDEETHFLERRIDGLTNQLPELKNFILPGGSQAASFMHLARTVSRRAERWVVQSENASILAYLNRLSDYFFVLARYLNFKAGVNEALWTQR